MNEYQTKSEIVREWIFCGILFAVMIILGGYALVQGGKGLVAGISYANTQAAIGECEKWNDWARIYPEWDERTQTGYFITPWQKQKCDAVGVELEGHLVDYKKAN